MSKELLEIHPDDVLHGLSGWLDYAMPGLGTPVSIEKFPTGQSNPTYRITLETGKQTRSCVLRKQPPGTILKSAHAIDREFRVMKALGQSVIPVPEMLIECSDESVIGTKFFLMAEIPGRSHVDPALPEHTQTSRHDLYMAKAKLLADMSLLDPVGLGLEDFGRASNYLERQFNLWSKQYRASETSDMPHMEFLLANLADYLKPDLEGSCVIHGDFRLDNLIIRNDVEIAAIIDWELSTVGPKFIDLSYWCAMLRMGSDWPINGLGRKNRGLLGIPTEQELLKLYCNAVCAPAPLHWEALIAFQLFRFASILQGVYRRHLDGNASSQDAGQVGIQARNVSELGASTLKRHLG